MPLFGEILAEINQTPSPNGAPPRVRRKYLTALHQSQPNRAVILYASAFLEDRPFSRDWLVSGLDTSGLMTAMAGIQQKSLDLILHTPDR